MNIFFPKSFLVLVASLLLLFGQKLSAQETIQHYLSGTGMDQTVDWEFYLSEGRKSGEWTTIPVPSQWELEGFGQYDYGHVELEEKGHEVGTYRHSFNVPGDWEGEMVEIVFEGSMTDTEVKINGELAGPIHQGSFYRFKYDISDLLDYDSENQLEVKVSKMSSNLSINLAERRADYWVFGGIFRPVYLQVKPEEYIERVAIDAGADGNLTAHVFAGNTEGDRKIQGQIKTLDGTNQGSPFSVGQADDDNKFILETSFQDPELWSPEWPNLYTLELTLTDNAGETLHKVEERFGFRTVELKPQDGFYINGEKIMFRGINRHSFWPESGRTTSKDLSIKDVNMMKDMNMNAVRMSHYPPDKHFLEVCDSLGLYVIDELAGWQEPAYDTEIGRPLVKSMVTRDVNHPSVVIWANGNERGHNMDLVDDYYLYDIQKRPLIHPIQIFRDVDNNHYRPFGYGMGSFYNGYEVFLPTEFLHGLYDGGHGAGLDDHWNLMLSKPLSAGMFLWDLIDQGIVRTDLDNIIDTDGNHAADGILGPYREIGGSYSTVKEIWSPVSFTDRDFLPETFEGKLLMNNHFSFTNLEQINFEWQLVDFPGPEDDSANPISRQSRKINAPSVEPGLSDYLNLNLPNNWAQHDALYLKATDPHGREIFTWSWPITLPEKMAENIVSASNVNKPTSEERNQQIILENDNLSVKFSKTTGLIEEIRNGQDIISLTEGPILNDQNFPLESIELTEGEQVVKVNWEDGRDYLRATWTLQQNGWLKFNYDVSQRGTHDFFGLSFNYPEEKINGMKWLGKGPFRVWKNRLKGQQIGVWEKEYNNTITGEGWDYPEFKGYHSDMYWAEIDTDEQPITIVFSNPGMYLHMLTPEPAVDKVNDNTDPPFPKGDISLMHGISPIGTKFRRADEHGPQGQKNIMYRTLHGQFYFKFGSSQ
ncbi:MAG: glycoside hydrolase family 2 TIM barrel-domain containing protein [Balneolales bacterium]